jgi:hypothetical protein
MLHVVTPWQCWHALVFCIFDATAMCFCLNASCHVPAGVIVYAMRGSSLL